MQSLNRLIAELARMPGVGPKTATRLAYYLVRAPADEANALADAIREVKESLSDCSRCFAITDVDPCRFCTDGERDARLLCVVEQPFNIQPIERAGFGGRYHVLKGAISPQRGIGPQDLRIDELFERLDDVREVILATNPNVEGEATALYLARRLHSAPSANGALEVSRLAFGMPVGGDIEYTDEVTLSRALQGRRNI